MLVHDKCAAFEAEIERLKKELAIKQGEINKLINCAGIDNEKYIELERKFNILLCGLEELVRNLPTSSFSNGRGIIKEVIEEYRREK